MHEWIKIERILLRIYNEQGIWDCSRTPETASSGYLAILMAQSSNKKWDEGFI
jgi:hypothetical protein